MNTEISETVRKVIEEFLIDYKTFDGARSDDYVKVIWKAMYLHLHPEPVVIREQVEYLDQSQKEIAGLKQDYKEAMECAKCYIDRTSYLEAQLKDSWSDYAMRSAFVEGIRFNQGTSDFDSFAEWLSSYRASK